MKNLQYLIEELAKVKLIDREDEQDMDLALHHLSKILNRS
jgi:hypothetical protein